MHSSEQPPSLSSVHHVRAPIPVSFAVDHRVGSFHLCVSHRGASSRLAVLGPSGSGKSTLLRCLAGLQGQGAGHAWFATRDVGSLSPRARRVGYVAQGFSLFPHLTVWRQLLFAADAHPAAAADWMERLQLDGLEERMPSELSGGQRQRVALAQSLARVPAPDVLLLDEPFAALDTPVRNELARELRRLQLDSGISTVVVTHDPQEAALLADDVLVVDGGIVVQDGSVREVFGAPASTDAARLLGVRNVSAAVVDAPGRVSLRWGGSAMARRDLVVPAETGSLEPGCAVLWAAPPEDVLVSPAVGRTAVPGAGGPAEEREAAGSDFAAVVVDVVDLGTAYEVVVELAGGARIESRHQQVPRVWLGDPCAVSLPVVRVTPSAGVSAPAGAPG